MNSISVKFIGHACFVLSFGDYRVVMDPYSDGSVPGLKPVRLEADMVICSHGHGDHNASDNIIVSGRKNEDLKVEEFVIPHDEKNGALRGMNSITRFIWKGYSLVHMGDVGVIPDAKIISELFHSDLVIFPVGGYYTLPPADAKSMIDRIQPGYAIPMHYRNSKSGYPVLSSLEDYPDYENIILSDSSEFILREKSDFLAAKLIALKAENEEK